MKRYEAIETLFCKTDLSFAQKNLKRTLIRLAQKEDHQEKPLGDYLRGVLGRTGTSLSYM
jgi:hypothetical protein